ncbi:MAG TPA: hypothetical protein PKI12_09030 [Bacteroidales bacterium]|nr:hypothetical protein [Bacteroidales bacterium]
METNSVNRDKTGRNILIAVSVIITVVLLYYSVMAMMAPVRKINSLKEEYSFRQDPKNVVSDSIVYDSAYLSLYREKAYLTARTAMAATDSLYLSMNLADSNVTLEISGVTVATTKLTRISASKIFYDRDQYFISSMLSHPFTVERNIASIPKMPLMIKMAPKDTSEYQPDIIPDTADYEPVNFIMEMDNGTTFYVYQEEKLNKGDRMHLFLFDLRYRIDEAWISMKSIFSLKVPEYHPFIRVRLPRADAKIIYRALPEHGQIAVYR